MGPALGREGGAGVAAGRRMYGSAPRMAQYAFSMRLGRLAAHGSI